ncbi:MAG: metallophosphoesterase [Deinococcota bacterium]
MPTNTNPIRALIPKNNEGHQFVCYADACSGVAGAPHEQTFAAVNKVISRLTPAPELVCFPGDEIRGLTADIDDLRAQWRYWFEHQMAWLDSDIPLYHTTGNHTVYDDMSETVYREVMAHLPQNGPADQKGLSYFVRRGDLLMVFVHTLPLTLGGEGRVEVRWLEQTLHNHADATHKLVFGHHPVHSVNGFSGAYQRDIDPDDGRTFWDVLVRHNVLAYVCSHILAFDVQVHEGVLQILTAGAGTKHRMPEGIEYLHCMQLALDAYGLRYQVLDTDGHIREWLQWPLKLPSATTWQSWSNDKALDVNLPESDVPAAILVAWHLSGVCAVSNGSNNVQTLLCGLSEDTAALSPLWIGLRAKENRLCVLLSPEAGRSPHLWMGPTLTPGEPFSFQLAIHTGMGPGGLLWRWDDTALWSSLTGATAWGAERLSWPRKWQVGYGQYGPQSSPFAGKGLEVKCHLQHLQLDIT